MLRLQWNALQVGDEVLVHDDADISLRLQPGTVAMVETAHGSNDLGVRVTGQSGEVRSFGPAAWRSTSILWTRPRSAGAAMPLPRRAGQRARGSSPTAAT